MGLKVELGGGDNPRRDGFVNVDGRPGLLVDHVCDFEQLAPAGATGPRLPFADDAAEEIYSSHCLEHVLPYKGFLHEIVRIGKVGAKVEIRVPHWLSSMALCNDHKHTVAPNQVQHWCQDFIADWWAGSAKRLKLTGTHFIPSAAFAEAKGLFQHLSDEQVMRFIPDACHEIRYVFEVIENR